MTKRRALLSVWDKSGIQDFGQALVDRGWEVLSTGGTARALTEAGVPVIEVSEVTGHPEMMDGRVKTLHPAVHAGILARRDREDDEAALKGQGYAPIDLVAVNLYPFRETVAKGSVTVEQAMEQVDIGGPTMIRSAAKNHRDVWVVVEPRDYDRVLKALDTDGDQPQLRRELATRVFAHTSAYDEAVATWLENQSAPRIPVGIEASENGLPESLDLRVDLLGQLRYGENPDQKAAFYEWGGAAGVGLSGLEQLHGKELSYNNYLDLDGALLCLAPFVLSPKPAVCIVKHTTPAGLAVGDSLANAYRRALRTDPLSSFGSVIAVNRAVDAATADAMSELFIECIVAPGYDEDALGILTRKKNVRLLVMPDGSVSDDDLPVDPSRFDWWGQASDAERATARFVAAHGGLPSAQVVRSVYGGLLVQSPPTPPCYGVADPDWKVVTGRAPGVVELDDLRFAWAAVSGVKSNAILLAKDGATLGIGAGQMSRVDASELAVKKAGKAGLDLTGSVLASDAFFPFRDGVDAAADAGVKAIIQPGGSIRDEEVIGAADEHGIAMVFTGRRLFRH